MNSEQHFRIRYIFLEKETSFCEFSNFHLDIGSVIIIIVPLEKSLFYQSTMKMNKWKKYVIGIIEKLFLSTRTDSNYIPHSTLYSVNRYCQHHFDGRTFFLSLGYHTKKKITLEICTLILTTPVKI